MVYALKYRGKYLRVGGMGRGRLMDRPEEGTLYQEFQFETAKRHQHKTYWVDNKPVDGGIEIVEVEFRFTVRPLQTDRAGWHNKPREGKEQ